MSFRAADRGVNREYAALAASLVVPTSTGHQERMLAVVDLLWGAMGEADPARQDPARPISWVGFYLREGAGAEALVLGPRRDKPACSPIGLHGACGRSLRSRRALVVRDVANLGAGYIACDPRDRAEVVVPCLGLDGSCWGVLDVDSYAAGAFSEADARGLHGLLVRAGLSVGESGEIETV